MPVVLGRGWGAKRVVLWRFERKNSAAISAARSEVRRLAMLVAHTNAVRFLTQSELRVRHRDETKNVTRLTMENVSGLLCKARMSVSSLFLTVVILCVIIDEPGVSMPRSDKSCGNA